MRNIEFNSTIRNKNIIDKLFDTFMNIEELEQRELSDNFIKDFIHGMKKSTNGLVTINGKDFPYESLIFDFKYQVKKFLNISYLEISNSIIVIITSNTKQEVADVLELDLSYIKEFPLNSDENIMIINLSSSQEESEDTKPLNMELLDFMHEIGVKYINGQKPDTDFVLTKCNKIQKQIEKELNLNINVDVTVENHNICILIYRYIPKEEICQILGLESDLFIEVSTPFMTALVCACPRIVFEEFYDKNEWDDAKGANKWLI